MNIITSSSLNVSIRVGVAKDKDTSSSAPAHVPMPDLTSQPLDPNEPTYCLCQQVSFGEMIGCDNDDVREVGVALSCALCVSCFVCCCFLFVFYCSQF